MDIDKDNRAVSFLRYLLILTTKNLEDFFKKTEDITLIRNIIDNYFDRITKKALKLTKKKPEATIISTNIFPNYIRIDFQALPSLDLVNFIGNLKSVTARKLLQERPEIRDEFKGCWNKNYFIATREQLVERQIQEYLNEQYDLRAVDKFIRKPVNLFRDKKKK